MRKRWKNWPAWPTWSRKPGREPRRRRLAVEKIEDRLMLSAAVLPVDAQGGFIDIDDVGFGTALGVSGVLSSAGDTQGTVTTVNPRDDGLPGQHRELERIGSEELAFSRPEGGFIDLTRALRETMFGESRRPLQQPSGMIIAAAAEVDEAIVALSTPAGTDPEISFAVVQQTAQPEDSLLNRAGQVSFSGPTLQRIDGSRGRSRAFELAIGFPAAPKRFPLGSSFRDSLGGQHDSTDKTADAVSSEEPVEKADPARREDDFGGRHPQGPGSQQRVAPGNAASADIRAAHQAVFARMASTESDAMLPGVFLDKKRPVRVAAVLTVVGAGYYLTTPRRQRSDAHPRQIWLPRDRGPLGSFPLG